MEATIVEYLTLRPQVTHSDGSPAGVVVGNQEELASVDHVLLQTSIVIPVLDDIRIFKCIESIDEHGVEIVVVSNGSPPEFLRILDKFLSPYVKLVTLRDPGIGGAFNAGIQAAKGKYILLMDSDCVFTKGAIRQLANGLRHEKFVKGRIKFLSSGFQSKITAAARAVLEDPLHSRRVSAYSPPLIYDRDVVSEMGGYHYAADLAWREDRDFELRRRQAEIPVCLAPTALIHHAPLSIRSDLRSVYYYGKSEAVGRRLGYFPEEPWMRRARKTFATARRVLLRDRMPLISAYFLIRRCAFNIGYLRQRLTEKNDVSAGDEGMKPEPMRGPDEGQRVH